MHLYTECVRILSFNLIICLYQITFQTRWSEAKIFANSFYIHL